MKKIYIHPLTEVTMIKVKSHLLVESGNGSLSIDVNQSVDADLVKSNNSYNVWDDDWSR